MAVIARVHDVATLDTYVGSDLFLKLFVEVPAAQRPSVLTAYQTARESCLKRKPVAAPKTAKADWKKPGEIERFKRTWLRHGGNKELVAHELGITKGSVAMAYSRFIRHVQQQRKRGAKNRLGRPRTAGAFRGTRWPLPNPEPA